VTVYCKHACGLTEDKVLPSKVDFCCGCYLKQRSLVMCDYFLFMSSTCYSLISECDCVSNKQRNGNRKNSINWNM